MSDADKFLQYINDNYSRLKWKYYKFCLEKDLSWDEDVYSETIVKCYDTIKKNGKLKDNSNHGIESYFFLAFKNNIRLEKVYLREKKRDYNVNSQQLQELYEDYCTLHNITARQKLLSDLFQDYATLYIMRKVEEAFDQESFYLYRLKTLVPNMTFKKLAEKCKDIKATRRKVLEVMRFVKTNVTKEEIRKSFFELYGDLTLNNLEF